MNKTEPVALRARAKRAYELGRLLASVDAAGAVAVMLALSLVVGQRDALTALVGAALLVLSVAFRWRGQVVSRAVLPGLLAGSAPLVLPLLLRSSGYCCFGGNCWSMCLLGCVGGGVLAGLTIGLFAAAEKEHRWTFLSAATLLAGLAGLLGCAMVGVAGIVGMAIAVIGISLPLAAVAGARTAA